MGHSKHIEEGDRVKIPKDPLDHEKGWEYGTVIELCEDYGVIVKVDKHSHKLTDKTRTICTWIWAWTKA